MDLRQPPGPTRSRDSAESALVRLN